MGAPGFWDDPDSAAKISAEHTRTQRKLDAFTKLQGDAEDLEGLVELAEEDPDIAKEVEQAFLSAEARLEVKPTWCSRPSASNRPSSSEPTTSVFAP